MRRLVGLAVLMLGSALVGCARGPVVSASYEVPPQVPLRSFPRVLVTSGHDPLEIMLAQELVRHLSADIEAWRVDRDRLEHMRIRGDIPAASLVVLLEVHSREGVEVETTSRPETVCGASGCYNRTRYDDFNVPTLRATAVVTVYEGPTARVLQRVHIEARERGRTLEAMQERILARLLTDVRQLVDSRSEQVEVRLLPVDLPGVSEALALIEAGSWREGRVGLETAAQSAAAAALGRGDRARLLYDLGIARRFDPVTAQEDSASHFAAAEAALRKAVQLDPRERYADALARLRAHRRATVDAARQREAAERNFSLEHHAEAPEPPPAVDVEGEIPPPPPPGYDDESPSS